MKRFGIFLVILFALSVPFSALIYRIFRYPIHSWGSKNLLFLSRTVLDPLIPDYYTCYDGCNPCSGKNVKIGLYKYLKIKEVWIWQNNEIKFYLLQNNSYSEIKVSSVLNEIEATSFIDYVNRGFTDNLIAIKKDFMS